MLQQWLKTISKRIGTASESPEFELGAENARGINADQPLNDRDYEFLFTQLLEGIAHGWQPVRIQRFFETLATRGTIAQWSEWLQRYGTKILASSAPNITLARRMVALGEQTRSLPELKQFGETASGIGRLLLARDRKDDNDTWQYDEQPLAPPPVSPPEEELPAASALNPPIAIPDPPPVDPPSPVTEAAIPASEDSEDEPKAIPLDELLVRLQGDENLVQQVAQRLGLDTSDPQEIIQELVRQINQRNAATESSPAPAAVPTMGNAAAEQAFNEGVQSYEAGRYEEAIASWDRAIQLKPDYHQAWGNRGLGLKNLKRYEEAIASYGRAVELKPDFYKAWYNRGLALDELNRYPEAIAAYDQVIAIRPEFHKAWFSRGNSLEQLGEFEGAIAAYSQAIHLKEDFQKAWFNRGQCLNQLGRYDEAIHSFDGALHLRKDDLESWQQRGLALMALGQYDEAVNSYARALSITPNDPDLLSAQGEALAGAGSYAQALAVYDQLITYHGDLPLVWCQRGQVLAALGWENDAIASYRHALELDISLAPAWYGCGEILSQHRDSIGALDCYDHALQREPQATLAWVSRAQVLLALNRTEEAIASFDRSLQLQIHRWQAWQGRSQAARQSPHPDLLLTSLSGLAQNHPALNQRGYDGQLATLLHGLEQVSPQQYPEAWARIQHHVGLAIVAEALATPEPASRLRQALTHYDAALQCLDADQFPQAYLEILQAKILAELHLEEFSQAQATYRQGRDRCHNILNDANVTWEHKRQLAMAMAVLNQLYVDVMIQAGELATALEWAEQSRNFAIAWLWERLPLQEGSLKWAEIQRRLDDNTAMLYWHCSPAGLTTFVITAQTAEPVVLGHTPNVVLNVVLSPSLRSRVEQAKQNSEASLSILLELLGMELETPTLTPEPEPAPPAPTGLDARTQREQFLPWFSTWQTHSPEPGWLQVHLPEQLRHLDQLLGIASLLDTFKDKAINHLILVPHQALQALPLHALFPDRFTISYLPSLRLAQPSSLPPISNPSPTANPWPQSEADEDWLSLGLADTPTPEQPDVSLLCLESQLDSRPDVALETGLVCHQFTKVQRLNADITSATASRQFLGGGYRYWHCFTPIMQNSKQPPQSYLALNDRTKLTFADLGSLALGECELISFAYPPQTTTPYPAIEPDLVNGMTALLSQGVTYVLYPLWEMDGHARMLFMIEFYRRLALGSSAIVAHKQVQLWLRTVTPQELVRWYLDRAQDMETAPNAIAERMTAFAEDLRTQPEQLNSKEPPYAHPYYWAAFVVMGYPF
ncbi:tetratricopeptide repeat protein [Spirulina major CS-329]|uniref:CHAT domain-containing protein n=1 Tax=Spirulina TaxID=1154 RepID=UPI00232C643E|nr:MULTISPECIES: tetratricopeptide repeat protein [Spirulina]MDB9493929.1 tetratricopeptide repeat protein [Spirulina subsalsa CS-330]MDB9502413.1 tetratricopeptide repeat protein [Spirulina major CS-329]